MSFLPDYEPNLIPEGKYKFQISEEPEKRKGAGGGIYIIFKFRITTDDGSIRKYNDVFVPWEERYKDLLLAMGGKTDEKGKVHLGDIDIIGKQFEAEIIHIQDPKDSTKTRDKISNIIVGDDVPPPSETKESKEDEDEIPF